MERSRPRPRVPRATKGAVDGSTHSDRAPKMGTGVNGTYLNQQAFGNLQTVERCTLADLVA